MGTFTSCRWGYKLKTFSWKQLDNVIKTANAYNTQPSNRLLGIFPREKSGAGTPRGREREGGEGGEVVRERERGRGRDRSLKHCLG